MANKLSGDEKWDAYEGFLEKTRRIPNPAPVVPG